MFHEFPVSNKLTFPQVKSHFEIKCKLSDHLDSMLKVSVQ